MGDLSFAVFSQGVLSLRIFELAVFRSVNGQMTDYLKYVKVHCIHSDHKLDERLCDLRRCAIQNTTRGGWCGFLGKYQYGWTKSHVDKRYRLTFKDSMSSMSCSVVSAMVAQTEMSGTPI